MTPIVDAHDAGNPGAPVRRLIVMRPTAVVLVTLALVAIACGGAATPGPEAPTTGSQPGGATAAPAVTVVAGELTACATVPPVAAPADWYRDTPIYVGNEMPVEAVREWAVTQHGFQSIWIDRDHNGWITVAFDTAAAERQADLVRLFPGVGAVAVAVDWKVAALRDLQDRVVRDLKPLLDSFTVGVSETQGVVAIGVGRLADDVRTELTARYAGLPVCIDEPPPGALPAPGPQPGGGEGWELLAAEKGVGRSYHTQLAWDADSLEALWRDAGVAGPVPTVDFESNIVIWFGAVFGQGCDDLRLDDVIVDGALVYAEIVIADAPVGCAGDANPYAFVVALDRNALPAGPFSIQLDADGPPGGVPEERTNVAADLSVPGSTVDSSQISQGVLEPRDEFVRSGDDIEPGFPALYRLDVHCGIEWLGELNAVMWFTDEPMPTEWQTLVTPSETIDLSITLSEGPLPIVRAVAGGVAVFYTPRNEPPPPCD